MKENTRTALYFSIALLFALYSLKVRPENHDVFSIIINGLNPYISAFWLFKAIKRILDAKRTVNE